ncbi:MAG: hypothetical protein RLZZ241_1301 [Bacteroidota bacterium]
MKPPVTPITSVNQYISGFPEATQIALNQVRKCIQEILPEAEETLKYGIPTYVYKKKNMVHFGGYKRHVGFYPTPRVLKHFEDEIAGFVSSKGAVQFPLDTPMPFELIAAMTAYRKEQVDAG